MRHYNFWIILVAIGLSSCLNAQQPDNKKPMYGEVPKSERHKKIDAEFISAPKSVKYAVISFSFKNTAKCNGLL